MSGVGLLRLERRGVVDRRRRWARRCCCHRLGSVACARGVHSVRFTALQVLLRSAVRVCRVISRRVLRSGADLARDVLAPLARRGARRGRRPPTFARCVGLSCLPCASSCRSLCTMPPFEDPLLFPCSLSFTQRKAWMLAYHIIKSFAWLLLGVVLVRRGGAYAPSAGRGQRAGCAAASSTPSSRTSRSTRLRSSSSCSSPRS